MTPRTLNRDGELSIDVEFDSIEEASTDDFLRRVAATSLRAGQVAQLGRAGQTLAGYRLGDRLGAGGMGIVYRATDPEGREVALKVMRRKDDAQVAERKRFAREARAALSIVHENVARVLELGDDGVESFIAMELLSGENLAALCARGRLELGDVTSLGRQIAAGLAAAHAAGVIHRDLKPENIMVEPGGRAKLLDFGLARWISGTPQQELASLVTAHGSILGTPGYMSPEQSRGESVDARSDLFSLGVILFEMISGRRPFVGETKIDVFIATNRAAAPSLSMLRPETPDPLVQLVASMLEKDPDKRPQTAEEVVVRLTALATVTP